MTASRFASGSRGESVLGVVGSALTEGVHSQEDTQEIAPRIPSINSLSLSFFLPDDQNAVSCNNCSRTNEEIGATAILMSPFCLTLDKG